MDSFNSNFFLNVLSCCCSVLLLVRLLKYRLVFSFVFEFKKMFLNSLSIYTSSCCLVLLRSLCFICNYKPVLPYSRFLVFKHLIHSCFSLMDYSCVNVNYWCSDPHMLCPSMRTFSELPSHHPWDQGQIMRQWAPGHRLTQKRNLSALSLSLRIMVFSMKGQTKHTSKLAIKLFFSWCSPPQSGMHNIS